MWVREWGGDGERHRQAGGLQVLPPRSCFIFLVLYTPERNTSIAIYPATILIFTQPIQNAAYDRGLCRKTMQLYDTVQSGGPLQNYIVLHRQVSFYGCLWVSMVIYGSSWEKYGFADVPHKLVYIEWFTSFRAPDPVSKLHSVSRTFRHQSPAANIVPLTDIVATCHLLPKFGTRFGSTGTWTHDTALENCQAFTLNKYIDISTWYEHERHVLHSYP